MFIEQGNYSSLLLTYELVFNELYYGIVQTLVVDGIFTFISNLCRSQILPCFLFPGDDILIWTMDRWSWIFDGVCFIFGLIVCSHTHGIIFYALLLTGLSWCRLRELIVNFLYNLQYQFSVYWYFTDNLICRLFDLHYRSFYNVLGWHLLWEVWTIGPGCFPQMALFVGDFCRKTFFIFIDL